LHLFFDYCFVRIATVVCVMHRQRLCTANCQNGIENVSEHDKEDTMVDAELCSNTL
jgi:hypothetical protein